MLIMRMFALFANVGPEGEHDVKRYFFYLLTNKKAKTIFMIHNKALAKTLGPILHE